MPSGQRTVAIAAPYPLDSLMGNLVTAHRLNGIFGELGFHARVSHGWDGMPADLLVALHAVKSAQAVRSFREANPGAAVITVMTGTDLYRDLPAGGARAWRLLEQADRVVVSTESAMDDIPEPYRSRVVFVPKSLDIPEVERKRDPANFGIGVIGHLRDVKNPFHVIETVAQHPEWDDVLVWQLGESLSEELAAEARAWQSRDPRYRWLGGQSREETLKRLGTLAVSVNSSVVEGASNAVMEAMVVGVPVLASRTAGALGLLGPDYPGLFDLAESGGLGRLLERLRSDEGFAGELVRLAGARARKFTRGAEKQGWRDLLASL